MDSLFRSSMSTTVLKWLGLVTAVWVQSISGNNYTFSNYSDSLKSIMGLTQLELNQLSVAKDVGKAFGLVAGICSDRIPTWSLFLIGSIEGLIGYGGQWLVVSQKIKSFSYWEMCIFMCLGGNSTAWMNTAVLVTCIRNFRNSRGPVSGILKGFVGLSTAIFTDLCAALFNSDPASFLAMLAIVPFAVCISAMLFLREIPTSENPGQAREEFKYFNAINGLAVVVAVYLLIYDFIPNPSKTFSLGFSIILLALLATPLAIPMYSYVQSLRSRGTDPEADKEGSSEPLLISASPAEKSDEPGDIGSVSRKPVIGEEHTLLQTVWTVDFWFLFVSFLCGVGTGMAIQNNMGQIGLALGYADVSIFVSLISIWGFFGRIISGTASEYCINVAGTPRPIWNAASQVIMVAGYVSMAMDFPGCLYIGSILVGFCYGIRIAITVPIASELFGLKNYGMIYNILILNLPLGSFLFSGLLAGYLYDAEATPTAGGGNTCVGAHCYRLVFIIMSIACVVGCALDILLVSRTRKVYTKIHNRRNSK